MNKLSSYIKIYIPSNFPLSHVYITKTRSYVSEAVNCEAIKMPLYEGLGLTSEKHAVVIDIGAAFTKCGYAGSNRDLSTLI